MTHFDKEKFKNITHYIIAEAEEKGKGQKVGATKLNKILWYSDAVNFLKTGKSMTGETYIKQQFGPVPSHVLAVTEELKSEQKISQCSTDYWGKTLKEHKSLTKPENKNISSNECSIINSNIDFIMDRTAKEISDLTHDDIWSIANIGEEIPLSAIFAKVKGEITNDDIQWAKAKIHAK